MRLKQTFKLKVGWNKLADISNEPHWAARVKYFLYSITIFYLRLSCFDCAQLQQNITFVISTALTFKRQLVTGTISPLMLIFAQKRNILTVLQSSSISISNSIQTSKFTTQVQRRNIKRPLHNNHKNIVVCDILFYA